MLFVQGEHLLGTAAVLLRVVADAAAARVFLRPVVHPVLVTADLVDSVVDRVLVTAIVKLPILTHDVIKTAATATDLKVVGEGLIPTAAKVTHYGIDVTSTAKRSIHLKLVLGALWNY